MVIFHSYVTVYQRVSAISSYDSWDELTVADDSWSETPARQATSYFLVNRQQFEIFIWDLVGVYPTLFGETNHDI